MSLESSKRVYSIRELIPDDKESVLAIWSEGRSFLKEMGVSQWQKGDYPGEEAFLEDLKENIGRVVVHGSTIVAVFAFTLTPETSYSTLKGSWKTKEGEYLTIHRSAVKKEEKGNRGHGHRAGVGRHFGFAVAGVHRRDDLRRCLQSFVRRQQARCDAQHL